MSLRTQVRLRAVSRWRGACLLVKRWSLCVVGVAPSTQVPGCAGIALPSLSRLCCDSGNVCGLLVGFDSSIESSFHWTGWCCFGWVLAPPFREYIKWTFLALAVAHLCSRHDQIGVVGYLMHVLLCGLGCHWCSSTHLHLTLPYLSTNNKY